MLEAACVTTIGGDGAAPEIAMSSKLAIALKTVLEERGLAANLGDAAKKIGIAYPSLKKVLDGNAKPNKATAKKYQSFLGVADDDFATLMSSTTRKGTKAEKPEKKKAASERGRQGRKQAAETEEVLTGTNNAAYSDTAEKELTRAMFPTTQPAYVRAGSSETALNQALAALDSVLKDDLALRIHAAPAGIRALISRMLG